MPQVVSPFIDAATAKKIIFIYATDPKDMLDSFEHEVRAQHCKLYGQQWRARGHEWWHLCVWVVDEWLLVEYGITGFHRKI